jgi:RNA polymerase sigma factor (sigma-70 family)
MSIGRRRGIQSFHMDADTQIGGMNARFPETRHSAIVAARSDDDARRTVGYDAIIAAYWKPVYRYIRARWRRSNEDAKDLTQSFFTLALEKRYFQSYDSGKGTFRTYLRTCLDRYLANESKFESRQKRYAVFAPVDCDTLESPEVLFEREWARNLFEVAVNRLRESLHARGRDDCFTVFARYDLAEERVSYGELARELGITSAAVTNYLAAARRELRRLVLEQLRSVTPDEREFRREARTLLQ